MKQATQVLVNHQHKDKSFHVLAKSGNLYVGINDEMIPLSKWLLGRADMPDSVEEVFNPEATSEWAENIDYISNVECLCCLYEGVYWRVYQENGVVMGYHPQAEFFKAGDKELWVLVDQMDSEIVSHHKKSPVEDLERSMRELESEIDKGILTGDKYTQELQLIKAILESKK